MVLAIHVAGFTLERRPSLRFRQQRRRLLDDTAPMLGQKLRGCDGLRECDRPAQRVNRLVARWPVLGVAQRLPATDHPGGIAQVDGASARRQVRLQRPVRVGLGEGEHDDLVVRQQVLLDRPREGQAMKLRSVDRLVVHREHFDSVTRRPSLRALGIEARRRGHVEALPDPDAACVVHEHEGRGLVAGTLHAGRPVRLVAEHEVEGWRAVVRVPARPSRENDRCRTRRSSLRTARAAMPGRRLGGRSSRGFPAPGTRRPRRCAPPACRSICRYSDAAARVAPPTPAWTAGTARSTARDRAPARLRPRSFRRCEAR